MGSQKSSLLSSRMDLLVYGNSMGYNETRDFLVVVTDPSISMPPPLNFVRTQQKKLAPGNQ